MVGASSSDVNPIPFPVSHVGGAAMLAASLLTGMRLVLFDAFDPATTPAAIAAHRPTLLGTATPFFVAFMAAQQCSTAPSRCFPIFAGRRRRGSARSPPSWDAKCARCFQLPASRTRGGSPSFPSRRPPPDGDPDVLDHTVGRPVPGVSVRVVDDTSEKSPREAKGN